MDGKIAPESQGSSSTESEQEILEQHLRRASEIARLVLSEGELKGLLKDAETIFEKFSEIRKLKPRRSPVESHEAGESVLREDGPPVVSGSIDSILEQVPEKGGEGGRLVRAPKSL